MDLLHGIFHTTGSFYARGILNWGPDLGSKLMTRMVKKKTTSFNRSLEVYACKNDLPFKGGGGNRKEVTAMIYPLLVNMPLPH